MAEPPVRFAGMLRRLRAQAALTQEELAEAAGLNPRTVSDLERGLATTPAQGHGAAARRCAAAGRLGPGRVRDGRAGPHGLWPGRRPGVAAATRTLPRDVASFTGGQHELAELAGAAAGTGAVVSIHAIGGMAGIGKTAFAVHAAHRLAGRFPAGQVFLPLHAHTPGRQPVDPADALASLLVTIGVPAGQIPATRPTWRPGPGCGGTGWPDGSCCWSWTTRRAASRSGRCCPAAAAAWCWSPAGGG